MKKFSKILENRQKTQKIKESKIVVSEENNLSVGDNGDEFIVICTGIAPVDCVYVMKSDVGKLIEALKQFAVSENKINEIFFKEDTVMVSMIDDSGKKLAMRGYAKEGIGIFNDEGKEFPAGIAEDGTVYGSQVDTDNTILNSDGDRIEGLIVGEPYKLNESKIYEDDDVLRNLDGEKVWYDADAAGRAALEKYKKDNPEDKYGGSSVLGATIWIKGTAFPNPVVNIQMAGLESMGQSRINVDDYTKKDANNFVEWYGIPVLISQGGTHQEVYADAVVKFLSDLGFKVNFDAGNMD